MAISKLNKLLKSILNATDADVAQQVVEITTPGKTWDEKATVTKYKFSGLKGQTGGKAKVMELMRADADWVAVNTTQRKAYKKTVNYAFQSEKHNAIIYLRSVMTSSGITGKAALSTHYVNVYYVVGKSKLNDLWLLSADTAAEQKAAKKAAKVEEKAKQEARDLSWLSNIQHKDTYDVPSMADFRACLWVNLKPAIEANTSLFNFTEMVAKKYRKFIDNQYLARRGLSVKEMTDEKSELFMNSIFKAIEAVAKASKIKAERNGEVIVLSNKHTRQQIRMIPGVFTGGHTYVKVGP
jgi:hypothetical protein